MILNASAAKGALSSGGRSTGSPDFTSVPTIGGTSTGLGR